MAHDPIDPWLTRTDHDAGLELPVDVELTALTVVHHPIRRLVGRVLLLEEGVEHRVGRGGDLLGPSGLDDAWISRRHATLRAVGERIEVRDLGSHNGTWVDGIRVDAAVLEPGHVLGVGSMLLVAGRRPAGLAGRPHPSMVGISPALLRLRDQIARVAREPMPVTVQGETGTGKELVARALHAESGRPGPIVAVNCGAVADSLVHSELFGHVRGAFSQADRPRGGLVASAAGGTLFLDEIGDASPALQASLLRLLENREYRPVGSDRTLRTDARFVVATHVDLTAAADAGRFRADLWGRLGRSVIEIPPLRERPEDILPLASHLAERAAGRPVTIGRRLALALLRHPWNRNVRELQGVVEQALLEHDGGELDLTSGVTERLELPPAEPTPPPRPRRRRERPGPEELTTLLDAADGNVRSVAEDLGVGRNTLYRWLRDAEIDLEAIRNRAS